jgi:hypothetical protein
MIRVIPHEKVCHWGLGTRCFDRRMGVDDTGGRVEARVGNPPNPDFPVIVRRALQQVLQRIVGI